MYKLQERKIFLYVWQAAIKLHTKELQNTETVTDDEQMNVIIYLQLEIYLEINYILPIGISQNSLIDKINNFII